MIGRSHGIHAEPITAGLVFAGLLRRARARDARALVAARDGDRGRQDRRRGRHLRQPRPGDRGDGARRARACAARRCRRRSSRAIATPAYFAALARLGTAVERLALTVRHWQRTEVGEATEAFGKGQKGSLGDAAQEEPDPVARTCAGIARLLRVVRAGRRSRTSRSGTSATSRTRRSSG